MCVVFVCFSLQASHPHACCHYNNHRVSADHSASPGVPPESRAGTAARCPASCLTCHPARQEANTASTCSCAGSKNIYCLYSRYAADSAPDVSTAGVTSPDPGTGPGTDTDQCCNCGRLHRVLRSTRPHLPDNSAGLLHYCCHDNHG